MLLWIRIIIITTTMRFVNLIRHPLSPLVQLSLNMRCARPPLLKWRILIVFIFTCNETLRMSCHAEALLVKHVPRLQSGLQCTWFYTVYICPWFAQLSSRPLGWCSKNNEALIKVLVLDPQSWLSPFVSRDQQFPRAQPKINGTRIVSSYRSPWPSEN